MGLTANMDFCLNTAYVSVTSPLSNRIGIVPDLERALQHPLLSILYKRKDKGKSEK